MPYPCIRDPVYGSKLFGLGFWRWWEKLWRKPWRLATTCNTQEWFSTEIQHLQSIIVRVFWKIHHCVNFLEEVAPIPSGFCKSSPWKSTWNSITQLSSTKSTHPHVHSYFPAMPHSLPDIRLLLLSQNKNPWKICFRPFLGYFLSPLRKVESARYWPALPLSSSSNACLSYADLCCAGCSLCHLPLRLVGEHHTTKTSPVSKLETDRNSLAEGHCDINEEKLLWELKKEENCFASWQESSFNLPEFRMDFDWGFPRSSK